MSKSLTPPSWLDSSGNEVTSVGISYTDVDVTIDGTNDGYMKIVAIGNLRFLVGIINTSEVGASKSCDITIPDAYYAELNELAVSANNRIIIAVPSRGGDAGKILSYSPTTHKFSGTLGSGVTLPANIFYSWVKP